jgi:uncharacterized HAD superfamily protein/hypoxanthine phosphoribosyltransferase
MLAIGSLGLLINGGYILRRSLVLGPSFEIPFSVIRRHKSFNYKSLVQLNADIRRWSPKISGDFDVIVGVPRSGLLAATLLALHCNKPVMGFESFIAENEPWFGFRIESELAPKRYLVLDDSVNSGREIGRVRKTVAEKLPRMTTVTFAAVYATSTSKEFIDLYAEIVEPLRAFEWNIMNHEVLLSRACVDIDGVLCPDPTATQNDDGRKYLDFIANAPLIFKPKFEIKTLVTARLEKYRKETELWLNRNGVKYQNLVMLDLPDAKTRRDLQAHIPHKSRVYENSDYWLFIESSDHEGQGIFAATNKPVFIVENQVLLADGEAGSFRSKVRNSSFGFLRKLKKQAIKIMRSFD